MADLGYACLVISLIAAIWSVLASWLGYQNRYSELVRSAERAAVAAGALITLSTLILIDRLLSDDFSLLYVAQNSSTTTPLIYKVSALWGGQAGSLLLWVWFLSIFTTLVVVQNRNRCRELMPAVTGTLMVVVAFFLAMLQFVSNPFAPLGQHAAEGMGLNPLLQNPFMASHPPSLYLGYVGVAIPFAFAMAALMTGRLGNEWIVTIRRWSLFSWFFLGIGILQGGYWAYVELGWGGYWAWDPVENASLMPWLTLTAFIHSVMIQEKKGMLKVWNIILIVMSFCLSIFGTFITRSGVVSSVHSFTKSSLGPWFAAFWVAIVVASVWLLVLRLPALRTHNTLESLLSRESAFLFNNIIFIAICFTVFWGTVYPILSEAVQGARVSVGPPWFNQWVVPMGLALIFITGVGPLIAWRKASGQNLRRNFTLPAAATLLSAAILVAFGMRHVRAILALALCVFVLATIAIECYRGARARMKTSRETFLQGLYRLVARNKRRYGGYLVHVGMVMIFVGIAGSSAFQQEATANLKRGDSFRLGPYEMKFTDTASSHDQHKDALTATLEVSRDGRHVATLHPEKNYYQQSEQPTTEVAIYGMFNWPPNLAEDLYTILVDPNPQSGGYTFKAYLNPLISWIWLGGLVVILGTHVAVLPEFKPARARNPLPRGVTTTAAAVIAAALIWAAGPPAFSQTRESAEHVEGATTGPIVESPDAMKVTTQIQCFCGTCANQTLHDCTCGLAARERQKVAAALAAGRTPEAIIAAYVAEQGPQVRIVPEKRGLNLLGWWVPFAAAAAGLLTLLAVLRGWQRRGTAARAAQAPAPASPASEAERPYRERLEEDLKEFDA